VTEEQEHKLLADVKSITDRLDLVDKVFKAAKFGKKMELVFQCAHSGLYFDGSYAREWGRSYGIGLGPDVCSEVLDSDYDTPLPPLNGSIKRIEQVAFGVLVSKAQMDAHLADVDQITKAGLWAVEAQEDPDMEARMAIVRPRQLRNARGGALLALNTEWMRQKGLVTA
jgi:hypothetical protein